jgi:diamine N-acetyltransferase
MEKSGLVQPESLEFRKITRKNREACLALKTDGFVSSNADSFREARRYFFLAKKFLILDGDRAVGFLLLGVFRRMKRVQIWRLMIDEKYQNQGYGSAVIRRVVDVYRAKGYLYATAAVHKENEGAARLFRQLGFFENGQTVGDEIVFEQTLRELPRWEMSKG